MKKNLLNKCMEMPPPERPLYFIAWEQKGKIHSVFLSRMKRKTVLSITTDGSLKVKRSTVVFTNQFHEKTKKDKGEAITVFVENQRKDSNLIQSSFEELCS
ncbi:hypothetical protein H5410_015431 [Solanum commersonii]|uniref:Uncharacterized protein n=1 Tax=Solanum commersonii TaxID=4109 RepID=A0A9J5ZUH2_SOLCO|nr:hypothetical protein H5410_015431 [Solanum commersonii]